MGLTYVRGVVSGAEDELWGTVIARTNVGNIRLSSHQLLRTESQRREQHGYPGGNRRACRAFQDGEGQDRGEREREGGSLELLQVEFTHLRQLFPPLYTITIVYPRC